METLNVKHLFFLLFTILFTGCTIDALSYDYSAITECLRKPLKPQYNGGIVANPEFKKGLKGWSSFGNATITWRRTKTNNFIVAYNRGRPSDSFSQKLYLDKNNLYTFSAWVQVSKGNAVVSAKFKTSTGYPTAAVGVAEFGCWSMIKGGLTVDSSGFFNLYFECDEIEADIWVDSVSLQPFSREEWKSHQDESIVKVRKKNVKIRAVNAKGEALDGAKISINQGKPNFPFGSAITKQILTNTAYQNWFTSRFSVTVFENEMKWYSTENTRGQEDYSVPDAMVKFAKDHGIAVRGHNILWDDPKYQPWWVKSLSGEELKAVTDQRVQSVVSRYSGQLIAWDVMNENLHFSFFENSLGANASSVYFQKAHELDSKATMFLNEYNTIEESGDQTSSPAKYLEKLKEIKDAGVIGIGLEGHFHTPNLPYMRASIDTLAATGAPIWLTEVDVVKCPNQASYLEQVLREAHSHPAVQGIILWAGWRLDGDGCSTMCLTDENFKNLPTGDVVDKLIKEWSSSLVGTTDSNGYLEISLFHGDYDVIISHQSLNSSVTRTFQVLPAETSEETLHLQLTT